MNPFSRGIIQKLENRQLKDFIRRWDALETLVIRVYMAGTASPQDEREFQHDRA
jgi:hypothetical protein